MVPLVTSSSASSALLLVVLSCRRLGMQEAAVLSTPSSSLCWGQSCSPGYCVLSAASEHNGLDWLAAATAASLPHALHLSPCVLPGLLRLLRCSFLSLPQHPFWLWSVNRTPRTRHAARHWLGRCTVALPCCSATMSHPWNTRTSARMKTSIT